MLPAHVTRGIGKVHMPGLHGCARLPCAVVCRCGAKAFEQRYMEFTRGESRHVASEEVCSFVTTASLKHSRAVMIQSVGITNHWLINRRCICWTIPR